MPCRRCGNSLYSVCSLLCKTDSNSLPAIYYSHNYSRGHHCDWCIVTVTAFEVDGAGWQSLTYQQYYNQVTRAAKAFIKVSYLIVLFTLRARYAVWSKYCQASTVCVCLPVRLFVCVSVRLSDRAKTEKNYWSNIDVTSGMNVFYGEVIKVKKKRKKRNSEMWQVTELPRPPTLRYPHQSCHVCHASQPCLLSFIEIGSGV